MALASQARLFCAVDEEELLPDLLQRDHKGRYQTRRSDDGSASGAAIHIASGARLYLSVHAPQATLP